MNKSIIGIVVPELNVTVRFENGQSIVQQDELKIFTFRICIHHIDKAYVARTFTQNKMRHRQLR